MLSFRNRLIVAAVAAPVVCALLYWIDDDPPYDNTWQTVKEFSLITVIFLFPVVLGITWFFRQRRPVAEA